VPTYLGLVFASGMRFSGLMIVALCAGCGGFDPSIDPPSDTGDACVVASKRCEDGLSDDGCRALSDETHDDVVYRDDKSCADLGYGMSCSGKPGKYKTCS
jgi:hypothetical protein